MRPKMLPYWGMLPQIGWGVSDFEGYIPSILGYQLAISQIPIMFQQMSLLFHSIPLDGLLAQNGPEAVREFLNMNDEILRSASLAHPSTISAVGEMQVVEHHFENADMMIKLLMVDIGGRSGIPMSVLFPDQPKGMADSNEEDVLLKQAESVTKIAITVKPQYRSMCRILAYSCFGPDYFANPAGKAKLESLALSFNPPSIQTSKEKAESGGKFADFVQKCVAADMPIDMVLELSKQFFPDVEISKELMARVTQIPESLAAPDYEAAFTAGGLTGKLAERLIGSQPAGIASVLSAGNVAGQIAQYLEARQELKGRELLHSRRVPQPSLRREDIMARTLAAEYEKLFNDLDIHAQQGPYAVLHRLQDLIGERGVDAARLRARLNAQLVSETRRIISDLVDNGKPVLREKLMSMSLPSQEVFGQRIRYIRELYLDDAVMRIQGEEDDLKAGFLSRLVAWAEGESKTIDVADIVEKMRETAGNRARFFARDQFSKFNRSVMIASYESAEAKFYEWLTSNDVRVRETHRERNHRIYTHEELLEDPEWKSYNCILPGAKIEGSIIAGSKAWYSGGVKVIVTSGGSELSVTPNHPVLTMRGWMPARLLQKGDRLFRHEIDVERYAILGRPPYEEYAPTAIEDVFGALCPQVRWNAEQHISTATGNESKARSIL